MTWAEVIFISWKLQLAHVRLMSSNSRPIHLRLADLFTCPSWQHNANNWLWSWERYVGFHSITIRLWTRTESYPKSEGSTGHYLLTFDKFLNVQE